MTESTDKPTKKKAAKKTAAKKAAAKKKTVVKKAPEKKAAAKKSAPKKTSVKKAATKKVATKKKAAAKKSARAKQAAPTITHEQRWRMIAEAAYHRAEQRHFATGSETEDWLAAEAEIDAKLAAEGVKFSD